ncbi:MAG: alpha-galactosidase [Lapillicoccus sp.]
MGSIEVHHLRAGGVSVVVETEAGRGLPRVVYWGADLGDLGPADLETVALVSVEPVTSYVPDDPVVAAILPEQALGWSGWPGLSGHRAGADWSPLFATDRLVRSDEGRTIALEIGATDAHSRLSLDLRLELDASGLLRLRAVLTNTSTSEDYWLDALHLTLPVPPVADEVLDLAGRHTRERSPQRQPFHVGTRLRESRHGHGGHDASLVFMAGTTGFGFGSGEVWGLHVGWSGNQRVYAERLPAGGDAVLGGGELLLPGEVRLQPGATYESPWVYASYSAAGMDTMADRFHSWLRARPGHPAIDRPRPVIANTWEAVYFDVTTEKLVELADRAAEVGAERFVLDDGWFQGRRHDVAGLGDWYVDTDLWPEGLHPLVDHVTSLGMSFGLWVEPESVNPDSDLARSHPDWILSTGNRTPLASRTQQRLDLSQRGAWDYLIERLDSLLTEYPIDFLKWDLNRDIIDGGRSPRGEAAVHLNTVAVYALLDEIRRRHPRVEIESCAGGGGRIDLGILERTDRVWTSDSNDPLERQQIQRWTGLLIPPELMGAHIGAAHAHTTHRTHTLAFAAGTALFGHLGLELDLTTTPPSQLDELTDWIVLAKQVRTLLRTGRTVRGDHPDPALWVHGVVAADGGEALYAVVGMQTGVTQPPGLLRFPGLDEDRRYRVRLQPPGHRLVPTRVLPPWTDAARPDGPGLVVPGRVLARHGLQAPFLHPGTLVLLHLGEA